jgi:hypothetical protein
MKLIYEDDFYPMQERIKQQVAWFDQAMCDLHKPEPDGPEVLKRLINARIQEHPDEQTVNSL